jgi:hypothetical protein
MYYETQEKLYNCAIILMYVLYGIVLLGFGRNLEHYITTIEFFIKLYVGIFLLVRFNYFTKVSNKLTSLDIKIAFNAGFFLIFTTILDNAIIKYFKLKLNPNSLSSELNSSVASLNSFF